MISLNGLVLNDDLHWIDEFGSYERVAQHKTRTLGGISILQNQGQQLGHPITLESTVSSGWLLRTEVEQIQSFAEVADLIMPLVIGSKSYNVQFRHYDDPAFEAVPLGDIYVIDGMVNHYYIVTIKLVTV